MCCKGCHHFFMMHPEGVLFKISHLGHKAVDKLPSSERKKK